MAIIAKKGSGGDFIPAPAGAWPAVCVDVVDLGVLQVSFGGKTKKQHKIKIVWQLGEVKADNKRFLVSKRYTLSLHEKSALRKDLESWRGRAFTQAEQEGFDVETVLSVPCMLNVIHNEKDGTVYGNVAAVMKLPRGLESLTPREYIRVCDRQEESDHQDDGQQTDWNAGITDDDVPFSWPLHGRRGQATRNEDLLQMRYCQAA